MSAFTTYAASIDFAEAMLTGSAAKNLHKIWYYFAANMSANG